MVLKFASVTMAVQVTGDGKRRDAIFRAPLTPTTFALIGPPGSLSINSPSSLQEVQLQAGNNLISGTTLGFSPTGFSQVYYFIMSPQATSTNLKVLRGSLNDPGIGLVPNWPLVLAFGPTFPSFYIESLAAEKVSIWTV